MRYVLTCTILVLLAAILAAGCTSEQKPAASPAVVTLSAGDALASQAAAEFAGANYRTAATLYTLAQENYTAAGNATAAHRAKNMAFASARMILEFPFNRTAMDREIAAAYPWASAGQRAAWLDGKMTATLKSDGEVFYFSETAGNIRYHEPALMRNATAAMNHTPLYDELTAYTFAPQKSGGGPYGVPVPWDGTETLSVPRDELPKNGTLRLWLPLPIESGSQTNVTIVSVEPVRYVRSTTGTNADLGLVYFEIPLDEVNDPFLNVSARFRFVQHEQRFAIDPVKVRPYNTSDPGYLKYTESGDDYSLTPAMKERALAIVGNETNPYLQAEKIYWYIMDTLPYSHVPHLWLETSGTSESAYVLATGLGDCGTQSMYFTSLCRSLGIPARTTGGFQMFPGSEGTHFWAEYYLEGYGWIPVDVTAAETADWSYNATADERHRFKEYYFGSLDPYRYIIQKDVDIPLTPDAGDAVLIRMVVQNPKAVCDTCDFDPEMMLGEHFTVNIKNA